MKIRLTMGAALLALAGCNGVKSPPNLLDCYQAGNLRLHLKDNRIIADSGVSAEYSVNQSKIGWVVSVSLILVRDTNGAYHFVPTDDGLYDWAIKESEAEFLKVVSQDGVPFYFGKCLIGKHDS